jgi:hypothetical protein
VKKIISIMVALGLVLALSVVATPALAQCTGTSVTNCAVNVTKSVECENSTYELTFNVTEGLAVNETIAVKFPASAVLTAATATVDGSAATINAVTSGEIHILSPVAITAGSGAEVVISDVLNPVAGDWEICVKTQWDQCWCCADFEIEEGGDIDPKSAVWCPCHNITVDIIWGASTNITSVDGGTFGTDFIVDFDEDTLTIVCDYMLGLNLTTCAVETLNIDFDPGCNVTLAVTIADNATVSLGTGWNLMSLPIMPIDTDIEEVLKEIDANVKSVWYYDGCDEAWYAYKNGAEFGLETMETGKSYWVCTNDTVDLRICGYALPCPPGAPPCYCYCHCWNMVGFHSTTSMNLSDYLANLSPAGSFFGALTYTATGWQSVSPSTTLNPGQGYWMAFTADLACFAPPV